MSDSFYEQDYTVPSSGGNYMKFKAGENRFRILSKPCIGTVQWVDENGNPRPKDATFVKGDKTPYHAIRVRPNTRVTGQQKFFNMFVVFNYDVKEIQVLEITQKGLLETLLAYARNTKWGDPRAYDLNVTRTGEGKDSSYNMMAEPKEPLDPGVAQLYKDSNVDLNLVFDGKDPFAAEETDPSDVPATQVAPAQEPAPVPAKMMSREEVQTITDQVPF